MKKKNLYIVYISLAIWMIFVFFGSVSYDVNDDAGMNMAAAGAYGCYSQYLVYINVVLGYLFKLLYFIFPGINCYLWFYLIADLVATTMICVSVSDKLSLKHSVVLTVFINLALADEFYIHIHYSKSAVLYVVAACLYFAMLLRKDEEVKLKSCLLPTIMFVFGFCVRIQSFESVFPFVVVLFGVIIIRCKRKGKNLKRFLVLLIPIVSCIMCFCINYYAYYMTEWRNFKVSDDILIKVRDFGLYDYESGSEEYDAHGITANDFDMIHNWMFNDLETFNENNLRVLEQVGKANRGKVSILNTSVFKIALKEFSSRLCNRTLAGLLMCILLLSVAVCDRWVILANITLNLLTLAEYYYLIFYGRLFWRVEIILWISAVLIGGYLVVDNLSGNNAEIKENQQSASRLFKTAEAAFLLIMILFVFVKSEIIDNSRLTNGDSKYEDFQIIRESDAHFVMYNLAEYGMLLGGKDIFDIDRKYADYYSNITEMGGNGNSPAGLYFANKKGITNPTKALFEKDNVYFVGNVTAKNILLEHINEKYGQNIYAKIVIVDGVSAWKFLVYK